MKSVIAVTIGAVLCWALLSVVSRILLVNFGFDPWLFSFVQLFAGGAALLAISFRKGSGFSGFKRPSTWLLGTLRVLSAALYTSVLAWVSVLEAGVLGAISLPVIVVCLWLFLRQRPAPFEWVGHTLILFSAFLMAWSIEDGIRMAVVGLMVLNAVCLACMNLLAERHPENAKDTPGARIWFAGIVLLVTAVIFLAIRLLQGQSAGGTLDIPLLIASATVGITLRAPAMFLAFWSIRLAGARGYTAAIVLLPIFGMAFEQASVAIGLLEVSRFQLNTLALAILAIGGALAVLTARSWRARRV